MSKERKNIFILGLVSIFWGILVLVLPNLISKLIKLINVLILPELIAFVIVIFLYKISVDKFSNLLNKILAKYDLHPEWEVPISMFYLSVLGVTGVLVWMYLLIFFIDYYCPVCVIKYGMGDYNFIRMAGFMYLFGGIMAETLVLPFTLIIIYKNNR